MMKVALDQALNNHLVRRSKRTLLRRLAATLMGNDDDDDDDNEECGVLDPPSRERSHNGARRGQPPVK